MSDERRALALQIASAVPEEDLHNCAVFFSGAKNMRYALGLCRQNPAQNLKTYLHTAAHERLKDIPLFGDGSPFTKEEAVDVSALASAQFAKAARGNVLLVANKTSDRSTFFTVELPYLLMNDEVDTINGIDKMTWLSQVQVPILPRTSIVTPDTLRPDLSAFLADLEPFDDDVSDLDDGPPYYNDFGPGMD